MEGLDLLVELHVKRGNGSSGGRGESGGESEHPKCPSYIPPPSSGVETKDEVSSEVRGGLGPLGATENIIANIAKHGQADRATAQPTPGCSRLLVAHSGAKTGQGMFEYRLYTHQELIHYYSGNTVTSPRLLRSSYIRIAVSWVGTDC